MNTAQKKKVAALVLERLRAAGLQTSSHIMPRTETISDGLLTPTLDLLAKNGFETVVRHRSRQGERYVNKSRKWLKFCSFVRSQSVGEARFKYDLAPRDKDGKVYLNLLTCCNYHDANFGDKWKQIWVSLDKETATKALVLGHLPENLSQTVETT